MTNTVILRGARALGEAADNRSRATVRRWVEAGCPFTLDGNVRVFHQATVIKWCEGRGINFHMKGEVEQCSEMNEQKLRQARYKANRLQYDEDQRRQEYAPVEQMRQTLAVVLEKVRLTNLEIIQSIACASGLSDAKAQEAALQFNEGFERIASTNPYLPENRGT